MNFLKHSALLVAMTVGLAGCSTMSSMLDNKSTVPQATRVQTGNNLAMPPDLQLAPPGATTEDYQPNGPVAAPVDPNLSKPATAKSLKTAAAVTAPVVPVKQDIYQQYGISKIKADGTPKTKEELTAELKAAILKKKRETNPGYGTISNIGAIFKDQ